MKHSGVSPMDFRGRSQSRRVPCRKISIPLRIIGNPGGIVKRTAGRDNSVGVGRGFRARGGMAPWPSARAHFRRDARLGVSPKRNKRTLLALTMRPTSRSSILRLPGKNPREISLIPDHRQTVTLQIQRIIDTPAGKRQSEDENDVLGNTFVDSTTLPLFSPLNCAFGLVTTSGHS
jgi:hypothetical protein